MTDSLNLSPLNQYTSSSPISRKVKGKTAERNRMEYLPRAYNGVALIISQWGGEKLGIKSPRFWEYVQLWKWLQVRAQKEEKNLEEIPSTPGGIRMSVEYIRRVHEDQMDTHTPFSLRQTCHTLLDDYLMWFESEYAEFVFRCEQLVETQRMKSQYHIARKELEKGLKSGDKKMIEMYLKAVGRDKSEAEDKEEFKIEVVERYLDSGKVAQKKVVSIYNGGEKGSGNHNSPRGNEAVEAKLSIADKIHKAAQE